MAEHIVTNNLGRLYREAVRLQHGPVSMGILMDSTAFNFRVKKSKGRHLGQNVCV
jgi:hypothetical protein